VTFSSGTPFFLEYSSRRLFVLLFEANSDVAFKGLVLHLPAFGEEMNKSRAMVVSQARAMANQGFTVLVPDYFGTGDSSGDFSAASWTIWLEDMRYCLDWLQQQTVGSVALWGLRLGALMAIELAAIPTISVFQLILWNPVLQGEQYMLQFLRLRLANSMVYGEAKEKTADLKQSLKQDGFLEVAGYELSASMFEEVADRKAKDFGTPSIRKVFWGDVASTIKSLPVPVKTLVDQWQAAGVDVDVEQVSGPQFWATQEISRVDNLILATTSWLKMSCSLSVELENS